MDHKSIPAFLVESGQKNIQKVVVWVIIVVLLSTIIGNMGSGDNTTSDTTQNPEQSEPVDNVQSIGDSADKFVEEVKTAIQGAISRKDESISDVQMEISLDLNSQGLFLFILL